MVGITRPGLLTPEEAARLEADGEPIDRIRRSPKYVQFTELAIKALIGMVWVLLAYIGTNLAGNLNELAEAVKKLQEQDNIKTGQIASINESMKILSFRQDSAVQAAQGAIAAYEKLEREVRMLEYYLLENDGKLIKLGVKPPEEAIANKLVKQRDSANLNSRGERK